jgi:hypothetical protein
MDPTLVQLHIDLKNYIQHSTVTFSVNKQQGKSGAQNTSNLFFATLQNHWPCPHHKNVMLDMSVFQSKMVITQHGRYWGGLGEKLYLALDIQL